MAERAELSLGASRSQLAHLLPTTHHVRPTRAVASPSAALCDSHCLCPPAIAPCTSAPTGPSLAAPLSRRREPPPDLPRRHSLATREARAVVLPRQCGPPPHAAQAEPPRSGREAAAHDGDVQRLAGGTKSDGRMGGEGMDRGWVRVRRENGWPQRAMGRRRRASRRAGASCYPRYFDDPDKSVHQEGSPPPTTTAGAFVRTPFWASWGSDTLIIGAVSRNGYESRVTEVLVADHRGDPVVIPSMGYVGRLNQAGALAGLALVGEAGERAWEELHEGEFSVQLKLYVQSSGFWLQTWPTRPSPPTFRHCQLASTTRLPRTRRQAVPRTRHPTTRPLQMLLR